MQRLTIEGIIIMLRKLGLALSLSAFVVAPVFAAEGDEVDYVAPRMAVIDPVLDLKDEVPAQLNVEVPIADASYFQQVRSAVNKGLDDTGISDIGYGLGNVAKAGYYAAKDLGRAVLIPTEVAGAGAMTALAGVNRLATGADAATKNIDTAKKLVGYAGLNVTGLKTEVPLIAENAVKAAGQLQTGFGKLIPAVKNGAVAVGGAFKAGAAAVKGFFGKVVDFFTPNFDNVDFA
jgi:hypothetical protein